MRVRVLGSAAGGGFPQWNCNCPNCDGVRKGTVQATPRTQSSIAISSDNINWLLFNASPDILTQFQRFPELQPARAIRDTAVRAIVLMDAQIDHTTGLFMLREGKTPLNIYCTDMVYEDLTQGNPVFNILGHFCGVAWHQIPTAAGSHFNVEGIEDIKITAVPLTSKAPPYSPHRHDPHEGDNIGIFLQDTRTGKSLFYAPGLAAIEPHVLKVMQQADCLMVDGTCWSNDEMLDLGISKKRALDMGHLPQSSPFAGEPGMMDVLRPLPASRKILIHINNTNPILRDDSPERALLRNENIDVAFDGMDFTL